MVMRAKALKDYQVDFVDFMHETSFIKFVLALVFGFFCACSFRMATREAFFSNFYKEGLQGIIGKEAKLKEIINVLSFMLLIDPLVKTPFQLKTFTHLVYIVLPVILIETFISLRSMQEKVNLFFIQNYFEVQRSHQKDKAQLELTKRKMEFVNEKAFDVVFSLFSVAVLPLICLMGVLVRSKCIPSVLFVYLNGHSLVCNAKRQSTLADYFAEDIWNRCEVKQNLLESIFYVALLAVVFMKGVFATAYRYYLVKSKSKKVLYQI